MPLFDQDSLMELYEQQYSPNPPTGPAWYASMNIVFAIGSLAEALGEPNSIPELALDNSDYQNEPSAHEQCFQNACGVFTELVFTTRSILAVQALLGMVRYLQIFPTHHC
jgi:hypothetical protein